MFWNVFYHSFITCLTVFVYFIIILNCVVFLAVLVTWLRCLIRSQTNTTKTKRTPITTSVYDTFDTGRFISSNYVLQILIRYYDKLMLQM